MCARNEIGDHACHRIEEELDWLEIGAGDSNRTKAMKHVILNNGVEMPLLGSGVW
jgi:hypothetical protein